MSTLSATNLKNASSSSNNIVLGTDGSTTITTLTGTTITGTSVRGVVTSGTAVASTSGTAIDFTSIPSWVKRITVMLDQVSTTGASPIIVRLGTSSGIITTGYVSSAARIDSGATTGAGSSTVGLTLSGSGIATTSLRGNVLITNINSNTWVSSHSLLYLNTSQSFGAGSIALSGTLTQLRITSEGGTDTFDAGTINILYEG